MTNLKEEREAIIEEFNAKIKKDAMGLVCECGGGGTDPDDSTKRCEICGGCGIYDWSVYEFDEWLHTALLSHEEKVVARVLTQIARIPKMEFKMSDVQEALTLPITDESV